MNNGPKIVDGKLMLLVFCVAALFVACATPKKTTKTWTPWIRPVTNSTQMHEILLSRWPLEAIRDYCKTNRPIPPGHQFLIRSQNMWEGYLHTNSTDFTVFWRAHVEGGEMSQYMMSAWDGTNAWWFETGNEGVLAFPPGKFPEPTKGQKEIYKKHWGAWYNDGKAFDDGK